MNGGSGKMSEKKVEKLSTPTVEGIFDGLVIAELLIRAEIGKGQNFDIYEVLNAIIITEEGALRELERRKRVLETLKNEP